MDEKIVESVIQHLYTICELLFMHPMISDQETRRGLHDSLNAVLRKIPGVYDFQVFCDERNNRPDMVDNGYIDSAIVFRLRAGFEYYEIHSGRDRNGFYLRGTGQ